MAWRSWKDWEPHEKRLFWWFGLLFAVGNLVFANTFANLFALGFWGLPLGIGVSGSLTLIVSFMWQRKGERHGTAFQSEGASLRGEEEDGA